MVAYLLRMPAGIPGDINRAWPQTIETQIVTPSGTTGAPTAYGIPMVVDNTAGNIGNMRTITAADTATFIHGLLVRAYPTNSSLTGLGVSVPPTAGPVDVMVSGYMAVLLSGPNAATKDGQAYVWVGATSSSHTAGGWESASAASTITIPNCRFTGPADANGFTEVAFNV